MLMGRVDGLPGSSKDLLLSDPMSDIDEDEEADTSGKILYTASFEELATKIVLYDTILWVSISLLLILAWGIGILMLLYLPYKRYVLQKDVSSRKLYVTANEVVYKVSRPSYIPFWGAVTIEKHVPLSLVIDIIIEQGCLQSVYGIHTCRVESIAHGKAAPVDELHLQGVYNPGLLRKVIVTEASKVMQDVGRSWKPTAHCGEGEIISHLGSLSEGSVVTRSPSKSWKMIGSPGLTSMEHRGVLPGDLLLHKLEEVNKSVKKIELLIEKSQGSPESS
ncbi:uncharacterized protein LOC132299044 [Cornus florida]|uniref:uncharacterized protein LOC132299044 n=1 Tax=Cornus florida TaxID=4283 RepID=UPI0028973354|nr:uncharacterized protein LOC132299044 [Cornus florida]XP_059651457.1 uncharacterized protein LOC132299044 [Cornus florida]XP_059651459.1 uncharacterized protein LOC132299044 [Cornus florida]